MWFDTQVLLKTSLHADIIKMRRPSPTPGLAGSLFSLLSVLCGTGRPRREVILGSESAASSQSPPGHSRNQKRCQDP